LKLFEELVIVSASSRRFSVLPIYFAFLLDCLGLAAIYPILGPLLLRPDLKIFSSDLPISSRISLLGITIAAFPFAQFLSAPLIGEISDHVGRKKVFLVSISGTAIGYLITASGILARSFPLLIVGRLWTGCFAGNLTLCLASLADLSHDPITRTKNFGRLASIGGLSFLAGIVLGGGLPGLSYKTTGDLSFPFFLIAGLSIFNLFLMLYLYHDPYIASPVKKIRLTRGIHHIVEVFREKKLVNIYAIFFFFIICWSTSMQYLSAYLIRLYNADSHLIETVFIGIGVIWALTNSLVMKKICQLLSPYHVLLYTLPVLGALLCFCWFQMPLWALFTLFSISTFCAALSWTNCLSRISLVAEEQVQGRVLGINQSMGSLASIAGPLLGGLAARSGVQWTYLLTGLCALIAFVFLIGGKSHNHSHLR
jgi:MFS transporter, DHA1 family, tetracycline resistance protein